MLIAFDCRIIRDKNPAGISRVVLEFLKEVLSADRKNDYMLIFDDKEMKDFVLFYLRYIKKTVKVLILPFGILSFDNLFQLPKILNRREIDVYYVPYYFTSPFIRKRTKVILTVFDLMHFFYPYFKMSLTRKLYHKIRLAPRIVLRRADKIVTISINTSRDLIKMFHVPSRKIKMIYMGVSKSFRKIDSRSAKRLLKEKYGVNKKYILYVGRNEPHKNIKALVLAYVKLSEYLREEYKLVLVGKEDERYSEGVRQLIKKYSIEPNVTFTGYVDESELPYIYSAASVYVQPSFYEGFGIPILEAMACGVPVVSSNTASLPEVGGEAALYTDPFDVAKMSEQIRKVLENEGLKDELIEKGFSQVKKFSWFLAANSLVECFNELGGKNDIKN
ncbi:MAG TPA: glycosyltransferase family 1 protein [Patescibacteria group bacterium]|nr:glycosyltransferase family 1 protein [Patescibacteria group bacterium]